MKVGEYRRIAREKLAGQWGINAGITLLSGLLTIVISQLGEVFSNDSARSLATNILEIFVTFAFTYALYYIALFIVRGGRAELGQLFIIFQKKYYLPVLILNIVSMIVQVVIGLLIFLPLLILGGTTFYLSTVLGRGASLGNQEVILNNFQSGGFLLVGLVLLLLFAFVAAVISGIFKFAAYLKLDYPDMPVMQAIKQGWFLLKDRFGKYILLQLSFIGWLILGVLALFIGLLFVIPYINTSNAAFYDRALQDKMDQLTF